MGERQPQKQKACCRPAVGAQENHFPSAEGHSSDSTHSKPWTSLLSWEKPNMHLWSELYSKLRVSSDTYVPIPFPLPSPVSFSHPIQLQACSCHTRTSSKLRQRPAKTPHFLLLPALSTSILLSFLAPPSQSPQPLQSPTTPPVS